MLDYLGLEDIIDRGDEISARCPQHEKRTGVRENRPRHWSINKRSLRHNCFSCGYKGGIHRLVADVTGKSLWDVSRIIRSFGVNLDSITNFKDVAPIPLPNRLLPEVEIQRFDLPPDRALRRRHFNVETATYFGIRWDTEMQEWILPIYGPDGELWGWQRKHSQYVLNHPPRVHKSETLFGINVLVGDTVLLVESPLDVPYLHELGYVALASFGDNASRNQLNLIRDRCDHLILALDNDRAGIKATWRVLQESRIHRHIDTQILNYAGIRAKDPGEMTPKEVNKAVLNATAAAYLS